ncbi:uncharacterized protein N7473_011605 [Penicillium subrubescens]|uniref:uncharacterized protein n=1 Tax=Penicillium subrubescens TaxID=1316194 RepID=UPI0025452E25|nr:uncharacterized protein N7473_011605 [Penicillium subrubescens]KAJ5880552.1 hypothetical protein N7473_011605 [Penicillium subrubescens]
MANISSSESLKGYPAGNAACYYPNVYISTIESDIRATLSTNRTTPLPRVGHGQMTTMQSSGSEEIRETKDKSMP